MAGSTTARGYGADHQQLREWWRPRVEAGLEGCARCGGLIEPGEPWDLGHDDIDRSQYRGPEHRACNRGSGARRSNELRRRRPRVASASRDRGAVMINASDV